MSALEYQPLARTLVFPEIDLHSLQQAGLKAVLLDFDNTLYPYDIANDYAMHACILRFLELAPAYGLDEFCAKKFEELYVCARAEIHAELHGHGASHSRHLYFQRTFEKLLGRTCFELSVEFEELYWKTFIPQMEALPAALKFLEAVKQLDLKTCIVTDLTTRIQAKKLVAAGLHKYINYMVSSEEAGMEKPGSKIFELAMRKLGLNADQLIMIGDSHERDIVGAQTLGIRAFQVIVS